MKKIFSQRSELSLAAAQVGGNEDLLREIFLRLPARCLIKFKVVSRQWCSLISDPQFVQDHSSLTSLSSITPSGLYFLNCSTKSVDIETVSLDYGPNQPSGGGVPSLSFLDVVSGGGTIMILQSCNGLLLCKLISQSSGAAVTKYCVCNPTTRKHKVLPQPLLLPTDIILDVCLAFDPSESLHYRVVCVKNMITSERWTYQIEIYSSETESWRSTSCNYDSFHQICFGKAFYWNGTLNWIRKRGIDWVFDEFGLDAEKHSIISLPPDPRCDGNCKQTLRYVGQSRGYWHIIYIRSLCEYRFNVLEMDNDTFEWSVKYKVCIYHLLSAFPEIVCEAGPGQKWDTGGKFKVYAFSILSFIKGEKDADSELVLQIPGKVVSYKFKQKTMKVLRELPLPSQVKVVDTSRFGFINSYQFIDTLFPV